MTEASNEARRLATLRNLQVLDTVPEAVFDTLSALAADVCGTPIALVSLIDEHRQWFKSNQGLPGVRETSRKVAFCAHAIGGDTLFEVHDARADARFAGNPLVTGDPHIRFYAGAPIVMPDGERMGTVCVIDRQPRHLSELQRAALSRLSSVASACLQQRAELIHAARLIAQSEASYRAIVDEQHELISLADPGGRLTFVNPAYADHFERTPAQMIGRDLLDFVDEADRQAVRQHLRTVCETRLPADGVNRMVSRGRTRWVAWSNRPQIDERGVVHAIQSVGRDITEQREAELALATSEQRYRGLYESTPAIMHSIDVQGRLLSVSDLWLTVLGYTRDEVIGRPSAAFLTLDSARKAREEVLPEFFRTGRCDRVEYQFVRKDGGLVDVLLSAILDRDEQGAPLRSLAVLEDVSRAKQLAVELGRTNADLDAILDNVPALVGHWDRQGMTLFANREYQAAIGLPLDQIVGHSLQQIFEATDPTAYPALAPRVADVLAGQRQEFELAMLTTSGLRQLRMTLVPDQPEAGQVEGFYGMAHDITGRKALELRLGESELRYRSLFENLNSGFALHEVVCDATGKPVDYRFLAMNAAFAALTGFDPSCTIGRCVTELLPGIQADPADWIGVLGSVATTGVPRHFEQRSADLDRWFDVVAYRAAPGQFAVIAQDITHRREAERGLHKAVQEKETLLKEVYHRVKNNLQVVQSLLTLQRRTLPESAARIALDECGQRVRAMALVHEKLYQSGSLAALSLADYTADLLKQIGEATGASQRRLRLVADVAPVRAGLDSAIPFGLLVTELVTNALKHGFGDRPSGTIRVALMQEAAGVRLSVADDGIGIPADFKLSASPSMGLQLASNLARQLGGELAQEPGAVGACFTALLTRIENHGPPHTDVLQEQ